MSQKNLSDLKTMRDINDYCIGLNIPSLAQGMIEIPPPETLRKISSETVISDNVHTYRNRFGELDYRKGVQHLLSKEYNTNVAIENILATQGVSGGIVASLAWAQERGKTNEKGGISLVEPFYTYHLFQVKRIFGDSCKINYVPTDNENGFAPKWDELERAAKETSAIILTNPSNPSGRVWTKEELNKVVDITEKNNCVLILDECYSDMVWKPHVHYSPIENCLKDHVIVVRGFSKVLGCQSWRLGYLVSSLSTVDTLMKLADPLYICVPFLQHSMGDYLLNYIDDFQVHKKKVGDLMQENWKILSAALSKALGWIPIDPQGSMYGMFKHKETSDMQAVANCLKERTGVCPGSMFFANSPENTGYVRIHCGISREKAQLIVKNLSE